MRRSPRRVPLSREHCRMHVDDCWKWMLRFILSKVAVGPILYVMALIGIQKAVMYASSK